MKVIVALEEKKLHEVFRGASQSFFRQAGAYLRRVVQNSIKKKQSPEDHAQPGRPPFYHGAVFGGGVTFKQSIMFQATRESVLIGAIAGPLGALGALHEFGGYRTIEYIDHPAFGRKYAPGDVGPISTKNLKNYTGSPGRARDPLTGYPVAYVEIATQRMAEHATRLQKRLLKADKSVHKKRRARYPARPFMQPGYDASEPYLLNIWKNSL